MNEEKCSGRQWMDAARGIRRDVLTVLLDPEGFYSQKDVAVLLKKFEKTEVSTDGGR